MEYLDEQRIYVRSNECIWIEWKITSVDYKSSNFEVGIGYHGLGPLHTQAKSHDHEINRAQKRAIPRPSKIT